MSLHPEFAAALAELQAQVAAAQANNPAPVGFDLKTQRAQLAGAAQHLQKVYAGDLPAESTYTFEDKKVLVDDGEFNVRVVVPTSEDKEKTFPVLAWFHGGGWAAGDPWVDDYQLRILSVELQVVTVNVDYRLAPEHPFPVPLTDSLAALKWTVENAASIHVDTSKGFIIGGDSAGGNLTATLAHIVRDDPFFKDHPLTGQVPREPVILHPDAYPEEYKKDLVAIEENAASATLAKEQLLLFVSLYNPPRLDDPRFSPYYFPSHAGVAPAYIQYNQRDPLRDDAVVLEKILKQAGVKTKSTLYPDLPHAFYYFTPHLAISRQVFRDTIDGVKWLLAGAP
ncbi:Alpha/Beta hydrolase protein [Dichomitus squalens]|uniref:Alpha/Beta hydrolase protein n=1 Tax=Dichomitus squalens TaxID=114155 RepID=A0A4Q9NKM4_9APHY|nr:Alpha/Beta hydrolase protein [Dichomitus squalens]TBU58261.1 Alpha/Beta hydrolase protein [Dichomitus squalens]